MVDMSEEFLKRRKYPRHRLEEPIKITDRFSNEELGVLANISLDGIMIVGRNPLSKDSIYQIALTLPDEIEGKQQVEMGVDCLWVNASAEDAGLHWSGCQIIDYAESDVLLLERIIEQLKID